jgi:hypothetical protein
MLVQPEYEASPGAPVDPSRVNALAFGFSTYTDAPSVGKIWVDDLRLAGLGEQAAEAPPTPLPAEETSPPAQEEPTTPPKDTEQPKKEKGGLCSAPLFLAGLVLIGAGWVRKRR